MLQMQLVRRCDDQPIGAARRQHFSDRGEPRRTNLARKSTRDVRWIDDGGQGRVRPGFDQFRVALANQPGADDGNAGVIYDRPQNRSCRSDPDRAAAISGGLRNRPSGQCHRCARAAPDQSETSRACSE